MKRLSLLLVAILTIGTINAQDTTAVDSTKQVQLHEVHVTGVRADSKTPVTHKTIHGDDIKEDNHGQEISMILDKTPNITSSTDGGHPQGYTYFRLRGIDQTRVNMTLNGVPLNESEDQGVYFSNYPGFQNNIASMQIQRGVGTSANGTSSYAGSIDFESPTGIQKGTTIEASYGSFNTQRFNASYSTGLRKSNLALYTNFSAYNTDGYKYHSGGKGYSFFLSGGYYGKKDIIKITAFTGRSFNNMAWFAVSETDIANDPRTNYNSPDADDDFMQSFVQLQYTRSLSPKSTLATTVYYNRLDGEWDLALEPLGFGPDILNFQLGSNFLGVMSNFKYVGKKLHLNAGIHANTYQRDHAMAVLPKASIAVYNNTGTKREISAYTKAGYDIGKFTIFADAQVRYVHFSYEGAVAMVPVEWTFFNPKGGVSYKHNDKLSAYLSIGQAHREPTRTDMFAGEDDLIVYNEVTPEEVVDYEVGAKYATEKFNVDVNAFFMDFKNEITLIGALGSNGLPLMANVESSYRSGFEFDMAYMIHKNVEIDNNTSFTHARITGGGTEYQPLYTPAVISNIGAKFKMGGFYFGVDVKYHSESFIDVENQFVTPSFVVVNASTGYTYKKYSVDVQVNNLTDEQYYTNGYAMGGERFFFVNAPLSAYITLKVQL